MPEWTKYAMTVPGESGKASAGFELTKVSHTAHLRMSRRILEDGCLKGGLVEGKSKLNSTRTCVNWMSANYWSDGSIYGNVSLHYDWAKLVEGCQFFWVEGITSYRNPAYRILVTLGDGAPYPNLQSYDPATDDGPLRRVAEDWYWNGLASEFLFDRDIDLESCLELNFVSHHPNTCRNGLPCPDRGLPNQEAAARTMAFILSTGNHALDHVLNRPNQFDPGKPLDDVVTHGISHLYIVLAHGSRKPAGSVSSDQASVAVMKGAMSLFALGRRDEAKELAGQLASVAVLEKALLHVVNDHFGVQGWTLS